MGITNLGRPRGLKHEAWLKILVWEFDNRFEISGLLTKISLIKQSVKSHSDFKVMTKGGFISESAEEISIFP